MATISSTSDSTTSSDEPNRMYINFPQQSPPADVASKLNQAFKDEELISAWISLKGNERVQKKVDAGELPSDMTIASQLARARYRVDAYIELIREEMVSVSTNTEARKSVNLVGSTRFAEDIQDTIREYRIMPKTLQTILNSAQDTSRPEFTASMWFEYTYNGNGGTPFEVIIKVLRFDRMKRPRPDPGPIFKALEVSVVMCFLNLDNFATRGRGRMTAALKAARQEVVDKPIDVPVD